jgi:hypothetical protein
MTDYPGGWDLVDWTVMATNAAADRLIAISWHDPHLAFAATCEVLWWISILDELLERRLGSPYIEERKEHHIGDQLAGLRYARNRLTHKLDILEPVEPGGNLKDAAFGTPGYWKWCPLPAEGRTGNPGESEYGRLIAGHTIQSILTMVLTFLRSQAWITGRGGC